MADQEDTTLNRDEVREIIISEYNYWAAHGEIEAMGALANVLCAILIHKKGRHSKATNSIVRRIRASKASDDTLATAFDLTPHMVQTIRKEITTETTEVTTKKKK